MVHLLLVEDDPLVCKTLQMTLESQGHEVEAFANGRRALDRLANVQFDIVITDILMPDMDGLELIRAIRATNPAMRIIAMSGGGRRGNQDFLSFAETFGADAVLAKPFTGEELLAAVRDVLARARPPR